MRFSLISIVLALTTTAATLNCQNVLSAAVLSDPQHGNEFSLRRSRLDQEEDEQHRRFLAAAESLPNDSAFADRKIKPNKKPPPPHVPGKRRGDVPPAPGQVGIADVKMSGTGCPAGTATVSISPDNVAFTISYSTYLARTGSGSTPSQSKMSCQIQVQISTPDGYTYGIGEADYRGYALLQPGATALQSARYHFLGAPPSAFINHPLAGPLDDYWQNTDSLDTANIVYAPCKKAGRKALQINTEISASIGSSSSDSLSYIQMDSTDGVVVSSTYEIVWRKC